MQIIIVLVPLNLREENLKATGVLLIISVFKPLRRVVPKNLGPSLVFQLALDQYRCLPRASTSHSLP